MAATSKGAYTKAYVEEGFPKKPFRRRFFMRKRRPFELFWGEIIIIFLLVALLLLVGANYMLRSAPVQQPKQDSQVTIGLEVNRSPGPAPVPVNSSIVTG